MRQKSQSCLQFRVDETALRRHFLAATLNGGVLSGKAGGIMAFGTNELIIVLVAFFILFGAERLPKLARSLGQAKGEFHEGLKDIEKAGTETEDDLDRGGRTESAALAEKAEDAGVDVEGKTPDEVEEEASE